MVYLTDFSLKYAIDICLAKPKYVVYIAVLDDISIKKLFIIYLVKSLMIQLPAKDLLIHLVKSTFGMGVTSVLLMRQQQQNIFIATC